MKVSNIYIIALGIIVSLLSSCNFLDKEPTSTTSGSYFKNESEAELFLKGIYAPIWTGGITILIIMIVSIFYRV